MITQRSVDTQFDGYSSIPKEALKVTAGLFYGIAVLSVCARGAIRIITRRSLALDDYLLFAAFTFLTAVTGLLFYLQDTIYIFLALEKDPGLVVSLDVDKLTQFLNQAAHQLTFVVLCWTSTFFVKFSFLAFFRQMIRNVRHMKYYYWSIVGLSVGSWMFNVGEVFILCPYVGFASVACFNPSRNLLYVSMTGLVTGLDILTDILIVSIPILVLYRAQMRTSPKLSLGIFLCLSLVMVCLAITRASKIHGAVGLDLVWLFFWQYMEAVLAVIMGSLTIIRNLHVHKTKS